MTNYALLGALAAVLAAPTAVVQPAYARGRAAVVVAPAPAIPLTSSAFRRMAIVSDAFEIESSRLALARSRNPRVRRFAQRMIVDHTATSRALLSYGPVAVGPGAAAAVPSMAPMLDARHAAMLNQLAAASGRQFDRLYVQMQVMAHQEAVAMFAAYAQSGGDPGLVNFARQALPALQSHLVMAQRLARRAY